MTKTKLKPKKESLIELTRRYANNEEECVNFFVQSKFPAGFVCEKCGCTHYYVIKRHHVLQCKDCMHQHYLFANTIFQDNKLELFKLILGVYLFFTSTKGISAIELASELDINYKTALLLARKCRILMANSNSMKVLDSMFYEADTAYIGSKSKEANHQGCGTEQQPFLIALSTAKENSVPLYLKLQVIPIDNSTWMEKILQKSIKMSEERILNTDGKTTFQIVKNQITLKSEKINYQDKNHRLYWLNTLIGNIKNNILGIYHGVSKRELPLFLNEQQWRFNHRYSGATILNKVSTYLFFSTPTPKKCIIYVLNKAEPYFNPLCV